MSDLNEVATRLREAKRRSEDARKLCTETYSAWQLAEDAAARAESDVRSAFDALRIAALKETP